MARATKELVELEEWPANEHIGTGPVFSGIFGHRIGTRGYLLSDWPACKLEKGFRTRKAFSEWLKRHGSDRQQLADAIDFRATLGLR